MTSHELMVRSSHQVIVADKGKLIPESVGSCCLVLYRGKTFFISVSHVTNCEGLNTFIETNLPSVNGTTPLKPIGGLYYWSAFKVRGDISPEEFVKILEGDHEAMDITFAEVHPPLDLMQPEINFGAFKVEEGGKAFIMLEEAAGLPTKEEEYGFFGKIKSELRGQYLVSTNTLKFNLKYHRTDGNFHMFLAPEIIKDKLDYQGCSGAPILDSEGRIVALACKVRVNTKIIYGFSIMECKRLIDYAIDIEQLNLPTQEHFAQT